MYDMDGFIHVLYISSRYLYHSGGYCNMVCIACSQSASERAENARHSFRRRRVSPMPPQIFIIMKKWRLCHRLSHSLGVLTPSPSQQQRHPSEQEQEEHKKHTTSHNRTARKSSCETGRTHHVLETKTKTSGGSGRWKQQGAVATTR